MNQKIKLISETSAAKIMGKHKAKAFFDTFVKTGMIIPIIFPGELKRRYYENEVFALGEKLRVRILE